MDHNSQEKSVQQENIFFKYEESYDQDNEDDKDCQIIAVKKSQNKNKQSITLQVLEGSCKHYQFGVEENSDVSCSNCKCAKRKYCDKYCLCDKTKCLYQRQGCKCKGKCQLSKKCPCYQMLLECDPDICLGCFSEEDNQNKCFNNQITLNCSKKCVISHSKVCDGLGLFALENIEKSSLVIQYIGEEMTEDYHFLRDKWNTEVFYAFTLEHILNKSKTQSVIDSLHYGNKSRFINHSKHYKNLEPKNIKQNGKIHIGLYANRNISIGQELLFDYDGDDILIQMEKYLWVKETKPATLWEDK